jgi:beta-catenin-like protein 1
MSVNPDLAEVLVESTTTLKWLLERIEVKEYDSNKQYASEVRSLIVNMRQN